MAVTAAISLETSRMAVMDGAPPRTPGVREPQFGAADLVWEQVAEAAVRAYRAGTVDAACVHWRRGLAIANARFLPTDPRLGTTLTNYAFALRRRGEIFLARRHFIEAAKVFAEDWRWIAQMTPAGAPGQCYDQATLWSLRKLAQDLHRSAQLLEAYDEVPRGRLERWRGERPAQGCDLRKLLGANLLLVSLPAAV